MLPLKAVIVATVLVTSSVCFALRFDQQVSQDTRAQVLSDLNFIAGIKGQGATPLHHSIFGNVDGHDYKKFFEGRVWGLGMNACGSSSAVACFRFFSFRKIFLTDNYIKFSHPQIARTMVLFHEARHGEYSHLNWGHVTCPTPFHDGHGTDIKSIWTGVNLEGQPACDTTPKGSYGSAALMLKNIQKYCSNCNEKVKMDAGIYADDQFKRIITANAREAMRKDVSEQQPAPSF